MVMLWVCPSCSTMPRELVNSLPTTLLHGEETLYSMRGETMERICQEDGLMVGVSLYKLFKKQVSRTIVQCYLITWLCFNLIGAHKHLYLISVSTHTGTHASARAHTHTYAHTHANIYMYIYRNLNVLFKLTLIMYMLTHTAHVHVKLTLIMYMLN